MHPVLDLANVLVFRGEELAALHPGQPLFFLGAAVATGSAGGKDASSTLTKMLPAVDLSSSMSSP